ncbi:sugar phosphate isomerase/epimerase family protein [Lentiprolixibacter aurantiacus]|uniref:TIM barrel protein n=1 Tax=Lentiprolixibacter aurantiacus TaxID=2993939 RepID=A0AAE3MNV8_9FLAO|nr:TIM barrel protein [Lentiprolixibacter aurantiacus]MCX2720292.1 TIM barrel protein [Lentiprolixibacter aurantiacus]
MKNTALGTLAVYSPMAFSWLDPLRELTISKPNISLAQWSLNRAFFAGELDPEQFAGIASETYGIKAVEYVNAFYKEKARDTAFWKRMRQYADDHGVVSLLIMVDDEGELGVKNESKRLIAVENHYKWMEAIKTLGGHSIRVNAFGKGSRKQLKAALVDGLGRLAEFGRSMEISVLVENHGLHTSDAGFMVSIIEEVDNPYLGTLPDFGNWCLSHEWGSIQNPCENRYDPYRGVTEMIRYAKGVSAKSYEFDDLGEETRINYQQMLSIVKRAGYQGYIGIEYEGKHISEPEGIRATKKLIETAWERA